VTSFVYTDQSIYGTLGLTECHANSLPLERESIPDMLNVRMDERGAMLTAAVPG
jgi:hypothetical protein